MQLKFLFPDGANHTGPCSAFLFDPLRPDIRTKIGEASNCARSVHRGPGENRRGSRQLREGRVDDALRSCHRAYALDSVDAEIVNNLGYAYLRDGDPVAAEPLLLQALVFEPRRANALANLGQRYAAQGKLDEAVASLALAYRYSGNRAVTRRFLTRLAGDADEAASVAASRVLLLSFIRDDLG